MTATSVFGRMLHLHGNDLSRNTVMVMSATAQQHMHGESKDCQVISHSENFRLTGRHSKQAVLQQPKQTPHSAYGNQCPEERVI